jgi:hypothetical protein
MKKMRIALVLLIVCLISAYSVQPPIIQGVTSMNEDNRLNSSYVNINIGLAPAEREMFLANDGYDSVKTFIALYDSVTHNPLYIYSNLDNIGLRLLLLGLYSVRADFLKRTTEQNWIENSK